MPQGKHEGLTVNDDGVLVEKTGEPVPPLLIHAYGYLGYDPQRKKFLTFGRQFGNYFTTGERGVFREANRLFEWIQGTWEIQVDSDAGQSVFSPPTRLGRAPGENEAARGCQRPTDSHCPTQNPQFAQAKMH